MNLFIVNFDETATYEMCFWGIVVGDGDNLLEGPGDDAFGFLIVGLAHHGMRFAASGLSVGEDGAIIPLKYAINQGKGALFVDEWLCAIWGEDVIKGKGFGLLFGVFFQQIDLIVFGVDVYHVEAASVLLFLVHGADSDHNSDAFGHLYLL